MSKELESLKSVRIAKFCLAVSLPSWLLIWFLPAAKGIVLVEIWFFITGRISVLDYSTGEIHTSKLSVADGFSPLISPFIIIGVFLVPFVFIGLSPLKKPTERLSLKTSRIILKSLQVLGLIGSGLGLSGMLLFLFFIREKNTAAKFFHFTFLFYYLFMLFCLAILIGFVNVFRRIIIVEDVSSPPKKEQILDSLEATFSSTFQHGRILFEQGNFSQAIDIFEKELKQEDTNESQRIVIYNFLAQAYFKLEHHQKALTVAKKGLDLSRGVKNRIYSSSFKEIIAKSEYYLDNTTIFVEKIQTLLNSRDKLPLDSIEEVIHLPRELISAIISEEPELAIKEDYVFINPKK